MRAEWETRKKNVQTAYEKILRELQKSRIDGEEFIRLRRQIEGLRPLRERQDLVQRVEKEQSDGRRALLAEWEDFKAGEFRRLDRAAKKVNGQLRDKVQVEVTAAGDREPLFRILRDEIGGRLSEAIESLRLTRDLSLTQFVEGCRHRDRGSEQEFRHHARARRTAWPRPSPRCSCAFEELDLPPTTAIRLNTAPDRRRRLCFYCCCSSPASSSFRLTTPTSRS